MASSALDDFADDFGEISIGFEDEEAARQLEDLIRRHNGTLKAAKEQLRNLLKDRFSIEEILFQPDSLAARGESDADHQAIAHSE